MEPINMKKKYKSVPVKPSEITPKDVYLNRREFLKSMGIVGAGAALLAACGTNGAEAITATERPSSGQVFPSSGATTDELGDPLNTFEEITNYNNYYEFTTNKQQVAVLAKDFKSDPWSVEVYGLVNNPQTFALEEPGVERARLCERQGLSVDRRLHCRLRPIQGVAHVEPLFALDGDRVGVGDVQEGLGLRDHGHPRDEDRLEADVPVRRPELEVLCRQIARLASNGQRTAAEGNAPHVALGLLADQQRFGSGADRFEVPVSGLRSAFIA